jgi:hypothetical protein
MEEGSTLRAAIRLRGDDPHTAPAAGATLERGQPLPDGTFVESGTLTWSRGGRSRTFTVSTLVPLVWDASCTTERKIASGELRLTLADGGYIRVV